jgi:hypothetical protein
MVKNVNWSSCKVPFILVRFAMKCEFSRQIFATSSNIKFHENPSSESGVVPRGRTDVKLIVAFPNFADAPKNGDQKHLSGFPI